METYNGHVKTPTDAIILFEACRIGLLPRVQRRLSEKERQEIKSGSVFVWDEREAGMRRWTDGKSWSASRVSGSFLTYREMEGKRGGNGYAATPPQPQKRPSPKASSKDGDSEEEGPDGYRYKPDGLMKQSFSITTSSGQHLHLISYYARSSPTAQGLLQPSTDPNLRHIRPPKNMYPESTVNESTSMPAATRAPISSPQYHTGSPQPLHGSPYGRPPIPAGYMPQNSAWPPTPSATPPTAYAVYYPYPAGPPPPHGHSPMHFQMHPHHPYPPHVAPPTHLDRVPQPLHGAHVPPPPHHLTNGHPQQFIGRSPHGIPYAPHPAYSHTGPSPGPQLAPVHTNAQSHPNSEQQQAQQRQPSPNRPATSSATDFNPAVSRAPTSLQLASILNNTPRTAENGENGVHSRQGSKSPASNAKTNGYTVKSAINESTAPLRAANQAINALNSAALST